MDLPEDWMHLKIGSTWRASRQQLIVGLKKWKEFREKSFCFPRSSWMKDSADEIMKMKIYDLLLIFLARDVLWRIIFFISTDEDVISMV